jgi:hypothetical protein
LKDKTVRIKFDKFTKTLSFFKFLKPIEKLNELDRAFVKRDSIRQKH